MPSEKNFLARFFSNKKMAALFAGSILVLVTYQNCAKITFKDPSVGIQTVVSCGAPTEACQTDRGSGSRTCSDSASGPLYGSCVLDQCKSPYMLVAGQCVQECQPPGSTRVCPNVTNGSGTQSCDANGTWGTCAVTCNPGFYLNTAMNICVAEYLNFTVIASKKESDAAYTSITPTVLIQTRPGYQYRLQVEASPNLEILGVESGLDVVDIGGRISQCQGKANSQWNPMEPWSLEGPCSNIMNCATVKAGASDWTYNAATADIMGGCGWDGEISARRIGDTSTFRKKAKITIDALLCEPNAVIPDPMCPSGSKVCSADGRSAVCVAVTTTTTTLPPTTTTVTVTTTTMPVTTTTTLPVTTTTVTTTTRPPTTTTTRPGEGTTTTTRPPTTTTTTLPPTTTTTVTTTRPPTNTCVFNGQVIQNGGSVRAYQSATVPFGSTCNSTLRICINGVLTGSYAHASCTVLPPANCPANGGVRTNSKCEVTEYCPDGRKVRTYISTSVPGLITQALTHGQVGYITAAGITHDSPYTRVRWDNLKVRCENGQYVQLADGYCSVKRTVSCGGSEGGTSGGSSGGSGGSTGNQQER